MYYIVLPLPIQQHKKNKNSVRLPYVLSFNSSRAARAARANNMK